MKFGILNILHAVCRTSKNSSNVLSSTSSFSSSRITFIFAGGNNLIPFTYAPYDSIIAFSPDLIIKKAM